MDFQGSTFDITQYASCGWFQALLGQDFARFHRGDKEITEMGFGLKKRAQPEYKYHFVGYCILV